MNPKNPQPLELHFRALLAEGSVSVLLHRDASDRISGVLV
jgi:hypothetical protein